VERDAAADDPGASRDDPVEKPDLAQLKEEADRGARPAMLAYADALVEWRRTPDAWDEAIEIYERLIGHDPTDAVAHFHAGVAYRKRFDLSDKAGAGDFSKAVKHWKAALDQNPNQYIWRRRIQQYGPRLDKPYSFYDWVSTAREAIRERGESPHDLIIEPRGAELAYPEREMRSAEAATPPPDPDPDGRITRDEKPLIEIETIDVPSTQRGQAGARRVHLVFSTNEAHKAHWNNEVDELVCRLNPPEGVTVSKRHLTHPIPDDVATSTEDRVVEFEVRADESRADDDKPLRIPGYALYYVCEGAEGVCLYLRKDFEVVIN